MVAGDCGRPRPVSDFGRLPPEPSLQLSGSET